MLFGKFKRGQVVNQITMWILFLALLVFGIYAIREIVSKMSS